MITVIVTTAVVAFGLSALLGFVLVPMLRKLKVGQTIKEIGPTWHKGKEGTPTMGGIMFIVGIIIASVVGYVLFRSTVEYSIEITNASAYDMRMLAGLVFALLMGVIGFIDDYIKVVKKRNLGLSAKAKTVLQFVVIIAYLAVLYFLGANNTDIPIPFTKINLPLSILYYPIMALVMYFVVNAVNLTDGIDGLATSVTFIFGIGYMLICGILEYYQMQVLATALAAGCLGFVLWNFHPAKVFMGDTGSMFLGGMVIAIGMGTEQPLLMIIAGIIYIIEALSVVLQVISFKLFGKRIFKMSPIHHHYEMKDWSEMKIVGVFTLISIIAALVAIIGAYMYVYVGPGVGA